MRIRKKPLLPLCDLPSPSSVPFSSSTIFDERMRGHERQTRNIPEDQRLISQENVDLLRRGNGIPSEVQSQVLQGDQELGSGGKRSGTGSNSGVANGDVSGSLCFHRPESQRWNEEERRIPLKKRSIILCDEEEEGESTPSGKGKTTMTEGMTDIEEEEEERHIDEDEDEDDEEEDDLKGDPEYYVPSFTGGSIYKNGERGQEGSRCSRVNGRGWRCVQRTSGGYALCEHHRAKPSAGKPPRPPRKPQTAGNIIVSAGGAEKKKQKSEVPKARSVNSLLGLVPRHNKNGATDYYYY